MGLDLYCAGNNIVRAQLQRKRGRLGIPPASVKSGHGQPEQASAVTLNLHLDFGHAQYTLQMHESIARKLLRLALSTRMR